MRTHTPAQDHHPMGLIARLVTTAAMMFIIYWVMFGGN